MFVPQKIPPPNQWAGEPNRPMREAEFMGPEPKGYVLKFISGKYQGGEFPLEMEREIFIGRSSDLDMVLVEDMVSRKHSKISTLGGNLSIEDLGSTNGTFVNGEKVSKKSLKDGDRILVTRFLGKQIDVYAWPSGEHEISVRFGGFENFKNACPTGDLKKVAGQLGFEPVVLDLSALLKK